MSIPMVQKARIGTYLVRQMIAGRRRFPLVLMLEPLFACNLKCRGCGKIDYSPEVLRRRMSVEECLAAAAECPAPVVSIPGGEPLLHPDLPAIVAGLIARRRFVYLCTNALLVKERMAEFTPSPYLTFNVHIDALGEQHDDLVGRQGTFDTAVAAIRELLARGFRVTTNTTLFAAETPANAARLFDYLTGLGVEGMTVAPAFAYEAAADQGGFLGREGVHRLFGELFALGKGRGWRFNHSSLYLEFLAGRQEYACSPWGNPTRSIFGWQRPCYLLDDGFVGSYRELMETTDWDAYGAGRDKRCADCMVHCGYEATAVVDSVLHPLKAMMAPWRLGRELPPPEPDAASEAVNKG